MTRYKCDNCGKIAEMSFSFNRDGISGATWNYTLKFCLECGLKIEKIIEEGVN